jgi:hypothetical protein
MSEVAILVPVLGRPHRVEPFLRDLEDATEPGSYRLVFACSDQPTVDELDRLGCEYLRDDGASWGVRINRLFDATSEPYVFAAADDIAPFPGWLPALMKEMKKVDGVVVPADLLNPAGTLALISRRYILEESGCIDTPGVVICPEYTHNYSDRELFETAKARGRHRYVAAAIVEHLHPQSGKSAMDGTYLLGYQSEARDHALFDSRRHLWEAASISTS